MKKLTRREVLKAGTLTGAGALLGREGQRLFSAWAKNGEGGIYPLALPENVLYTVCLQCNTQCTIKAKIQEGILAKIDGNPYSPMNLYPHLPYGTPLDQAAKVDASICPKGQAGVETLYDPYRVRTVLKRAGPRGSNKWKTIPFEQALQEIVEGGKLFAEIGEDREVPGFKDVFVLRDPALAKAMAEDVAAIRAGKMTVEEFKAKYKDHLDVLIDPDHPDLGPKNNQFVLLGGRISPDREQITKRFTFQSLGSVNWYGHTTICEQAHHVAFKYALASWTEKNGKYSWKKGPNHMKPDYTRAEFVIFWGTSYNEANFGPTPLSPRVSQAIVEGKLKVAVIDPRLNKTAAKGWWIPIKPGGDLALALGMTRWILEHKRYDAAFLRNANKAAALKNGELSWTNATWLVNVANGKLLRASDLGLGPEHHFVALVGGKPVAVDPNDEANPVVGDLEVDTEIKGFRVKSGFRLLKEAAFAHTLEFYAAESGVPVETIEALAREFTAHGKRAAIDFYRGPIKFTWGFYAAQAIINLNFLIGNVDHVGGLVKGGGSWDGMGGKEGQPFPMDKLHPNALTPFGIKVNREDSGPYETSTLFKRDGYPAKRPWFPYTDDVYQEVIPSIAAGYAYPIKILWLHYGTPAYASPAGHLQIEMLRDTEKIPLIIATDVVIGETTMYADYIFPDLTYLERWGNPVGTSPAVLTKISKFRQPVAPPLTEIVQVDGEEMPLSMDTLIIALAKRIGASGFGKDAFGPGLHLDRPEDYYLKLVANLAAGDKPGDEAPMASDEELELFRKARRHLPKAVFDEERWKKAVGDEALWRRVVYLLNRGGRFEATDKAYEGEFVHHALKGQLNLYLEPIGTGFHSITGKRLSGVPFYQRQMHFDGQEVVFPEEYDLTLFTFKEILGGQSRTVSNYVGQLAIQPENYVYISRYDAHRLGLEDGDIVRILSPDFGGEFEIYPGVKVAVEGKLRVIEGIAPGSVGVSWHYGHWAYGARDVEIDGQRIPGDPHRSKGLVPNPAMAVDGYLKDVSLTDYIAGDSVFTGTRVKLVRVGRSQERMPEVGVMSAGPRMALVQPDDPRADELARMALEVARGRKPLEALQAEVRKRLNLA
ncbi:molybdopterin-dependent oxidoreductase [Thermus sp.]|uniref:molybdopterin-dependent oxidoreductase n=1 Tax=Thermus sp. TaxID=275 RepID=UPI00307E2641